MNRAALSHLRRIATTPYAMWLAGPQRRACTGCNYGSGTVSGWEFVPAFEFTDRRTGERRTFGGNVCHVQRTCPVCKGDGDLPLKIKRGAGGRR